MEVTVKACTAIIRQPRVSMNNTLKSSRPHRIQIIQTPGKKSKSAGRS